METELSWLTGNKDYDIFVKYLTWADTHTYTHPQNAFFKWLKSFQIKLRPLISKSYMKITTRDKEQKQFTWYISFSPWIDPLEPMFPSHTHDPAFNILFCVESNSYPFVITRELALMTFQKHNLLLASSKTLSLLVLMGKEPMKIFMRQFRSY